MGRQSRSRQNRLRRCRGRRKEDQERASGGLEADGRVATSRRMDQNHRIKQLWSRKLTIRSHSKDVTVDLNKQYLEERKGRGSTLRQQPAFLEVSLITKNRYIIIEEYTPA